MSLLNKTALVCGCTQGIGHAIATEFAENGYNLILFARNENKLQQQQQQLEQAYHIHVDYIVADFEDSDAVDKVINDFITKTSLAIDVLVNNVGGDDVALLKESSHKKLQATFNRHIIANHIISVAVSSNMIKNSVKGKIINICSNTAISPYLNLGLYAIRTAEIGYTRALALELASNEISVNNIIPGATDTPGLARLITGLATRTNRNRDELNNEVSDLIPYKRRFAEPREIAKCALMIASEENSYMTGSCIKIDGGFNLSIL